jgi:hypothetical protein
VKTVYVIDPTAIANIDYALEIQSFLVTPEVMLKEA